MEEYMPRSRITANYKQIAKAIESSGLKSQASINKLTDSFVPEMKGLRTDLREYFISHIKQLEVLKSIEQSLIKKVENNTTVNKDRNALLEQSQNKPSADAELLRKATLKGAAITSGAALLVFALQYYTSKSAENAYENKVSELQKEVQEKDTAIAARDKKIAKIPSPVWATLSLFEHKDNKPKAEPPKLE
jgi:hypothetical protein